jgi:asparagine synthase (glutamine-hydrolysing)
VSAIFGLMNVNGDGLPDRGFLRMRSALAAHGGDGSSTWTGGGAGLGQELKRVTPEDLAERQPLVSLDGLRAVVSDGRIDNRLELSGELGLPWESPRVPDSAFILAAYERWGIDCASYLIGSFCFAIWDVQRKRLLLARSPFGAKPVFYHQAPEFVAFATAPRAIFAIGGVSRELDPQSLADLLISVPAEPDASLYCGIQSLEPGHVVTADSRLGCRVRAFWEPQLRTELRLGRDEEYVAAFTELFDRVVEDQLRSVTPVAAMLSGGLDPASVAATAAPLLAKRGERLVAFTGAPERPIDEAPLAGAVAARHENLDLSVVRAQGLFLDGLDRYFDASDLPYDLPQTGTASRGWQEGVLAEAQRRGIAVLLTGTCGNLTVSWQGNGRARSAAPVFGGLLPRLPRAVRLAITRRRDSDPMVTGEDWWSPLSPIHPEFAREQRVAERSRDRACDRWPVAPIDTRADRLRHLMHDVHQVNVVNGAYAARYGVDIRDPTTDVRIAEFCLSLPAEQYYRRGRSRSLIRRAMADRLPPETLAGTRRQTVDTVDRSERLSGARAAVHEELRLLDRNEAARAMLDLPRLWNLADHFDTPSGDSRRVLERGLMMGRFLRWFDGSYS